MSRDLIKYGISPPCFHGDLFNKGKKFKSDDSKLIKSFKKSYS